MIVRHGYFKFQKTATCFKVASSELPWSSAYKLL